MSEIGKVALITGAASGLGMHLSKTLHSEGATIIIADVNEATGKAFEEQLNTIRPGSAYFHQVDISNWPSQVALFKSAVESVGRIDHVFANAGIIEPPWLPDYSTVAAAKPGDDFFEPDLHVIDINVKGALYTANLAIQVFRRQERKKGFRGKLIVTSSAAGIYPLPQPLYVTSKHGLVGLVRILALQHISEGITVNGVAPNVTRSNIFPKEVFDLWDAKGWLTKNETLTEVFMSYLGTSTENGLIKEVTVDNVTIRMAPIPKDKVMTEMMNEFINSNGNKLAEHLQEANST